MIAVAGDSKLSSPKAGRPQLAGRPIHDKTRLMGKCDITYQIDLPRPLGGLRYWRTAGLIQLADLQYRSGPARPQTQCCKGSVEMLVIDHVEQPSAN